MGVITTQTPLKNALIIPISKVDAINISDAKIGTKESLTPLETRAIIAKRKTLIIESLAINSLNTLLIGKLIGTFSFLLTELFL